MNNPRTKQHICKPLQPTRNQSLQKSCFLAKFTNDLDSCFWALNFGGASSTGNSIVAGLCIDQDNNPLITGQLYGTDADVNPLDASPFNLSSIGLNDCFVIKYNSAGTLWENPTTGIYQSSSTYKFKIFPNPTNSRLYLSDHHNLDFKLYNSLGQTINVQIVNNQIDVKHLPNGIYYLVVKEFNHKPKTFKFIKY